MQRIADRGHAGDGGTRERAAGALLGLVGLIGLVACGGARGPASAPPIPTSGEAAAIDAGAAAPSDAASSGGVATTAEGAGGDAARSGDERADATAKRKPFEIHNGCEDVVRVVLGPSASAPNTSQRRIAPSSSVDGVREADGSQDVWLIGPNGEALVKVHVSRRMKRVEIGRSCRTLDAR